MSIQLTIAKRWSFKDKSVHRISAFTVDAQNLHTYTDNIGRPLSDPNLSFRVFYYDNPHCSTTQFDVAWCIPLL